MRHLVDQAHRFVGGELRRIVLIATVVYIPSYARHTVNLLVHIFGSKLVYVINGVFGGLIRIQLLLIIAVVLIAGCALRWMVNYGRSLSSVYQDYKLDSRYPYSWAAGRPRKSTLSQRRK